MAGSGAAAIRLQSEEEFAARVDRVASTPDACEQLAELLQEEHPCYDQRGSAAIVRMRGWVLRSLAGGLTDAALIFVLEEIETGADPYLVAAAARALRSYPHPRPEFASCLMRAVNNIRYRNERVTFDSYGGYADTSNGTTPLQELFSTLAWLGPSAREILPDLESLRAQPGNLHRRLKVDLDHVIAAIRSNESQQQQKDSCCELPRALHILSWLPRLRRSSDPIEDAVFEDHNGQAITFAEFFRDRTAIVAFFYTRCDNPMKCSLTITRLARVQRLLESKGLAGQVRTAAITYDPAFDIPDRLRVYGRDRGLCMDSENRLLRATGNFNTLRAHFKLGVNFVESLVNRHRIEIYILDRQGRVAASFQRLHWDEQQVVDRVIEIRNEEPEEEKDPIPRSIPANGRVAPPLLGSVASVGLAFFPKCPVCWAAYLSSLGIAGLEQSAFSPWLQPLLILVMLVNLASVWIRGRTTGRWGALCLVSAGSAAILLSQTGVYGSTPAVLGVMLTLAGSVWNAIDWRPDFRGKTT
jgi:protein SCO1/2